MNSTFMGLEIGKRGIQSHQQALHVTGHNISNAENKEYSRQRVVITSAEPIYAPALNRANTPGSMGQGSVVSVVERMRDHFIDDRIVTEKDVMGYWKSARSRACTTSRRTCRSARAWTSCGNRGRSFRNSRRSAPRARWSRRRR